MNEYQWPYANEFGQTEIVESDVVVLGGGLAGCFAAIAAAERGQKVVLVEKGATKRSGSAGTGFDHWESACTNPSGIFSRTNMITANRRNKRVMVDGLILEFSSHVFHG